MKITRITVVLMLTLCINANAQQSSSQKVAQELQSLNSTYNSSEEQYTAHTKSGRAQKNYARNDVFVCESINYKRNHCYANTEGGIRLVRQISKGIGNQRGSCINNWGYDYYGVWVINGCRAEFAINRYEDHYGNNDGVIRCESYNFQRKTCRANLNSAQVSLIHQLSNASCAGNWGYNSSGIWVSNGCKADFRVSNNNNGGYNNQSDYVECSSSNRRTQVCQVPPLSGVQIDRIHSRPQRSCFGNWGYSSEGIWVKNGCRATFKIEPFQSHHNGNNGGYNGGPINDPGSELVRCKSKRYRYKACKIGAVQDVQLERVLDKSNCSDGNWGVNYEGGTIWVDNGCQGEFRVFR